MRAAGADVPPRVGITVGDPAGIGPEIVLKSLRTPEVRRACQLIVIGDAKDLSRQAKSLGFPFPYESFAQPAAIKPNPTSAVIFDTGAIDGDIEPGRVSARAGRAAMAAVEASVNLWRAGKIDAIATAPLNKEAIQQAGSQFPGHTEMLAALTDSSTFLMSFFAPQLRVILLTIHVSLQDAIKLITRTRVLSALETTDRELRRFGIMAPRIAVAGLNPHAGEHGLFGSEEILEMNPAVADARERGIDAHGPLPADTLFLRAAKGEFDAVVACYHDQGLIALKSLAFGDSAGVTLGLPVVRTSVDHGTAFDIAGKGIADPGSMTRAILLAADLANKERQQRKH
jgi:4-hydroxythreonine-4-phosphate dehydrogenase